MCMKSAGNGETQLSSLASKSDIDHTDLRIQRVPEWIYRIWTFWN